MASTYVNDLRLEEMANGENSGTWGTKTNVNLELIGEALGYGTRAIANASTDNITIADGTADADRAMYLVLTGGGQACTVTLLPNTSSKVWIMKNSTSFTLTFTQGSGANAIIAAGQTKIIATDGAGSGAVVHELGALTLNGDVTSAGTFKPLGDTAAADLAALGYTSVLGAIVTGQGSTNDVTLVNDADGTVLGIPTGTTNVDIVGDVTAANFQPDGDTAAGDTAALGYTSVLGAILTGQGSTNDVTLVNDADGTVLGIPTGTTNVDIVGDVTAANFQPDGDTAAGDTAALGYTSVLGAILTGQGSTNDVTLVNDADATVLGIPTGTTNVNIVGALTLGTDLTVPNGGTGASTYAANGILYGAGTSAIAATAVGNDGQVLTSGGSGVAPGWEDAGGGGAWNLIGTIVASNDASLTITGLDSTYDTFCIAFSDILMIEDNRQAQLQLGTSSGIVTSGYKYNISVTSADSYEGASSASAGAINLSNNIGNATGEGFGGLIYLAQPGDATQYPKVGGTTVTNSNSGLPYGGFVMGILAAVTAVDRVLFKCSSGNVSTGRMTVWGISHT
jgi:hypothetical protein